MVDFKKVTADEWAGGSNWQEQAKEKQTNQELFRSATQATVRALAKDDQMMVNFGQPAGLHSPDRPFLPSPPEHDKGKQSFRGRADRIAFWKRHHQPEIVTPNDNEVVRKITQAMELVRVEELGARYLKGSRDNMFDCAVLDAQTESNLNPEDLAGSQRLALAVRESLRRSRNQSSEALDKKLSFMDEKLAEGIDQLSAGLLVNLQDQKAFERQVLSWVKAAGYYNEPLPQEENEQESEDQAEEPEGHEHTDSDDNNEVDEEEQQGEEESDADAQIDPTSIEFDADESEDADELQAGEAVDLEAQLQRRGSNYKVFTKEFDQVVKASDLLTDPREIGMLKDKYEQLTAPYRRLVKRLANRLQRLINVEHLSEWHYNLEEGYLDPRRLNRIVTEPLVPASYMWENVRLERDTLVTILIDSSGSMRGKLIALAAMSAEVVASTLERCSVKTEILGFTTRHWKGGQSQKKWLAENRPQNPGRVSDLLHLVYKEANTPWRKARQHLGLMLREGLLKDNVDGEALIWAHDRLMRRPERRKILMVISDGAPVDDSTLLANGATYLDAHLKEVISTIQKQGSVELVALGIGHDVSRYYEKAVTLHKGEDLAWAMLDKLSEFLKPSRKP